MARPRELTIMMGGIYPNDRSFERLLPEACHTVGCPLACGSCRLADVHNAAAEAVRPCRREATLVRSGERMRTHKSVRHTGGGCPFHHWGLDAAHVGEESACRQYRRYCADQLECRLWGHGKHDQVCIPHGPRRCIGEVSYG